MITAPASLLSAALLLAAIAAAPVAVRAEATTTTASGATSGQTFALSAANAASAISGIIHPDAKSAQPLNVGDPLPAAAVKNAKGETIALADATKGKSTIIIFYRGSWCPYCNTHLADLAKLQPELTARGVQILAISPDSPATIAAYPADKQRPYALLSDTGHAAARAFGIAFKVDPTTVEKYKGYGINLVKATGTNDAVLPVPAVFIIGPDNKITFAHTNPDYRKRLTAADLQKALGPAKP